MLPWLADAASSSPALVAGVRETSLGKIVRDEMLALILRGELAPGQRINEPDVAARLNVSRVPVREALRELESTGLVAARKHAGVFVRRLEPREVADLHELRSVLDGHAGRRAAAAPPAARRALVQRLKAHVREMKSSARARDVQGCYAANLAFHWAVVEAAGNQALAQGYRGIVQQLHLSRLHNLSRDVGMQASLAEHDDIVAAIAAGDAPRAQALATAHVMASHERLVEQLGAPAPEGTA
ncbi:MAG: FCD domain-containing protein [Pelomonas sp.]|nr:FCD domain-containing protein [Roseateles sp.]